MQCLRKKNYLLKIEFLLVRKRRKKMFPTPRVSMSYFSGGMQRTRTLKNSPHTFFVLPYKRKYTHTKKQIIFLQACVEWRINRFFFLNTPCLTVFRNCSNSKSQQRSFFTARVCNQNILLVSSDKPSSIILYYCPT